MSNQFSEFTSINFNKLINSSKDQIAILDKDFKYLNFNRPYEEEIARIFGRKLEVNSSLDDILSHLPEDLAKAKNIWGRALKGETYTIHLDFGDNNLERKFYEIHYSPLTDDSGKVIAGLQVARDLTIEGKLRQAEVVLDENERRFRLLAEGSSDVISTYLPDSTIVYISPSCEKILGYQPEELIGLKAVDFYHPKTKLS